MAKASPDNTIPSFIVDLFSLHIVFDMIYNISSYFQRYWSLFHSQLQFLTNSEEKPQHELKHEILDHESKKQLLSSKETSLNEDGILFGQDINMVMGKLGIQHSFEGEDEQKRWNFDEISEVLEEEPCLEEVKEAFDVFDQNKDGFIDAMELKRVLSVLGLRQGSELHACSNMIRAFDKNDDGKIDFNEFVRFMMNVVN